MRGSNNGSKGGYGGSIFEGEKMISPGAQQAGCFRALENKIGRDGACPEKYHKSLKISVLRYWRGGEYLKCSKFNPFETAPFNFT